MASVPLPPSDGEETPASGLTILDTLSMPDEERRLVTWLTRQREASLDDVAGYLEATTEEARSRLNELIQRGYVQKTATMDGVRYRTKMAVKPNRRIAQDIWKALD
jgi:predicted ArsR family transcriptional regulator